MCGREEEISRQATSVLLSVLTPAQAQQYQADGYFDVDVNGRCYRIAGGGRSYNVVLMQDGKPVKVYCAVPCRSVPTDYSVLAQLLMLTTNEAGFLELANVNYP